MELRTIKQTERLALTQRLTRYLGLINIKPPRQSINYTQGPPDRRWKVAQSMGVLNPVLVK